MLARNPYRAAVPQNILEHPDTDINMLNGYCQERGITYGERPSLKVLRAKLMASNADVQTVWNLRMTTLAAAALTETPEGQSHLAQFQAAIYHQPSVAAEGSRESDQLYLQYCRAKRAEEARDLEAQRNAKHSELKGMLVSLRQTVRPDMLFTATMEAELMEARMASSPLAIQLQRIVRLTHVSPGKPGVFGLYVVYGLYECAGREAAEDPAVGAPALMVNKEKQGRMKNIIANKADIYVRHLIWLHTVLPEIFETPAKEATYEEMEEFTMTNERCDRLLSALKLEAHKAKYPLDHAVLSPAKARMSMLRDLLAALSADHGYESSVDVMLKTPPFAARLSEASRRIGPRYHSKPSAAAHSQLDSNAQSAAAAVPVPSVVPSPEEQ
ncbi:hypothetical protein I4F81_011878 [Pyropia yezoensis]|uniref:Uncharacterized protein n=1 Tax=Pyropia yezoensis TaxID=2788 RepID=A0ACC3CGL5_PYRYE|nr:hypothetical protein I4F81_011878 [Neopyropia yezoensis]